MSAPHPNPEASRVMASCVRASLLNVVEIIDTTSFAGMSGDEAARSIAKSVRDAADRFYRHIIAEIDAEARQ